eukprot:TRINITY_DN804_c0_g1_i4.p2 TRINITY_DN804_c0_g1~~TRINITY_DN804_c0_g1_i4.p2  ORF type:complete len:107 (-),score=9.86 TRINITY_DN804_c0_g1_i4:367-687(-)
MKEPSQIHRKTVGVGVEESKRKKEKRPGKTVDYHHLAKLRMALPRCSNSRRSTSGKRKLDTMSRTRRRGSLRRSRNRSLAAGGNGWSAYSNACLVDAVEKGEENRV